MKKIRLSYFGSPSFSARFLEKIILDKDLPVEVVAVITQPDQPVGRKQILTPTPVKIIANKYKIKVSTIGGEDGKWGNLGQNLLRDIDLGLVYAYSQIIPAVMLQQPKFGFWNIHPSLLPYYRGPSPTAFPLINGDKITGTTIIKMDEKIDHGPIITQEKLKILLSDKRPDLEIKLTDLGYTLFKSVIPSVVEGSLSATPQNHSLATYTRRLTKADGFVKLSDLKNPKNSQKIYNLFRGLYPWPGPWTQIRPLRSDAAHPKRLKITDLDLINNKLVIKKVQLEGKKEVDWQTFVRAYNINITSPKE